MAIQQYGGTNLTAVWSFDLTMRNLETNAPWDLSRKNVQDRVRKMGVDSKPFMFVGVATVYAVLEAAGA